MSTSWTSTEGTKYVVVLPQSAPARPPRLPARSVVHPKDWDRKTPQSILTKVFGKGCRLLTPALARKCIGQTVWGVWGQRWMDRVDGTEAERASALSRLTIVDVVNVTQKGGLFGRSEETLGVVMLDQSPIEGRLLDGYFGTGNSHNAIAIFPP